MVFESGFGEGECWRVWEDGSVGVLGGMVVARGDGSGG